VQVGGVDASAKETVILGSKNGMAMRFDATEDLRFTSRTSRGVRSMRLREGDEIAGMSVISGSSAAKKDKEEFMLVITEKGYGKRVKMGDLRAEKRGGIGSIAIKFKKNEKGDGDKMVCLTKVTEDSEVLIITHKGVIVRQKVKDISVQGKVATGVVVQKVQKGDFITRVTVVPSAPDV